MNRGLSDCRTYKVSAEYRDDMVQSVGADRHDAWCGGVSADRHDAWRGVSVLT